MAWIFMEIESLMWQDLEEPKKFLSALNFSLDCRLQIYFIFWNNRWILIGGILICGFQNNQDTNWWGINWWRNGKMLIQLGGENLRGH